MLGNFHVETRDKHLKVYYKNTLKSIRAGLASYLLTVVEDDFNNDTNFVESNKHFMRKEYS